MKLLIPFVALVLTISLSTSTYITLVNNEYQKILVGISPNVKVTTPDDVNVIIKNIKNVFTRSSKRLYDATRKRSYFKDVHILLPDSFPHVQGEQFVTWENYKDSDIFVDVANPLHGDVPYANQPKGCGKQGDYIHVTPQYLTKAGENLEQASAQFVHVWSRFRYGVYEEYGHPNDDQFPMFYYDQNENIKYTACSDSEIIGDMKDVTTGGECVINGDTYLPDYKCGFFADEDRTTAQSSIMSVAYLKSIYTFCDDDKHPHNRFAPNKHNSICNGESTWSVVTKSIDFATGNNERDVDDTTPTFTIVRTNPNTGGDIVFVLDVSSSMTHPYSNRIDWVKQAMAYWIEFIIPDKTNLGIVKFSTDAKTVLNMTEVSGDNRWTIYDQYVKPIKPIAKTAIGLGIRQGLQVLRDKEDSTVGDIMILLTDGVQNVRPNISEVVQEVVDSGVRVITIALSSEADPEIELLAAITNGYTFYVDDNTSLYALTNALQIILDILKPYDSNAIVLENTFLNQAGSGSFIVDKYISEIDVNVMYTNGTYDNVTISLVDPQKHEYKEDTFERYDNFSMFNKKIAGATSNLAGLWNYKVSTIDPRAAVAVRVVGYINNPDINPITASAWGEVFTGLLGTKYIFLYAQIRQGYNPVLNADVTAYVTTPIRKTYQIKLLDNGNIVSDLIKGDGIYSRVMTSYDGRGRYTFNVVVNSGDETYIINAGSKLETNHRNKRSPTSERNLYPQEPTEFNRISSGDFQRNPTGFAVNFDDDAKGEIFAPGQVKNLVAKWNESASTFSISWTASGSSLDSGKVNSYELKYATKQDDLSTVDKFVKATSITASDVKSGSLDPTDGGSAQYVTVGLKDKTADIPYFFALRSISGSQTSDISNIASASTANKDPPPITEYPETTTSFANSVQASAAILLLLISAFLLH